MARTLWTAERAGPIHPALLNLLEGKLDALDSAARRSAVPLADPFYGLKQDGTDETAKVQAAINDAVSSSGPGKVSLPAGDIVVNGGLGHGIAKMLVLEGQEGSTLGAGLTKLKRTVNGPPILTATGTGQAINQRSYLQLRHLTLDGGYTTGVLLASARGNDLNMHDVRLHWVNDTALYTEELWNAMFSHVYYSVCGAGDVKPAVLLHGITGPPIGNTDTVLMMNCQWESCHGTELKLSGILSGGGYPSSVVQVVNFKMERYLGQANAHPFVNFDYAQSCKLAHGSIGCDSFNTERLVIQTTNPTNVDRPNSLIDVNMTHNGAPSYFIDHTQGSMILDGLRCEAPSAGQPTAFYRIGSGVGARDSIVGGFRVSDPTKAVLDQRASTARGVYSGDTPIDVWHAIGAAGEPAFTGTWVNFDPTAWEAAGFFKDRHGVVHLKGLVKNGAAGAPSSAICTLPAGYRPAFIEILPAVHHDGTNFVNVRVDVTPAGVVAVHNNSAAAGNYTSLSGISFRAA